MKNTNSQVQFITVLLASTFLMASSFIAGKILLSDGFPPFMLVGWRFLFASLAVLPILCFEKDRTFLQALFPKKLKSKHIRHLFIIGLLQTTGVIGLIFWAMESVSANIASILLYTNPLWVAVLGSFLLKENLYRKQVVGLILGIIGVVLAIGLKLSGEVEYSILGLTIGLASAVCWSLATIVNKKTNVPFSPWTLTFWQMFIGSIFLLIISYIRGEQSTSDYSLVNPEWFFWLVVPGSTIALGLWFKALSINGATKSSGYLFLCPAFTILISFFIFDKHISGIQLLGGLFIAVALLLISNGKKSGSSGSRRKYFSKYSP